MEDSKPLPQYKEIIAEIARQLNSRKGLFLRRIAFVAWPLLALGVGLAVVYVVLILPALKTAAELGYLTGPEEFDAWAPYILWAVCVYLVFALFWTLVSSKLFSIEKNIWADSFFDGMTLSPEQSWKISKRLFFPIVRLDLYIFIRYGALAVAAFFIFSWLMLRATANGGSEYWMFVGIPTLLSLLITYAYVVSIKLRYMRFLFLDLYGTEDYSSQKVLQTMRELNQKIKNTDLKKILAIQFGVEAVSAVIASVVNTFLRLIPQSSQGGQLAKGELQTVAAIIDSEIREYALIIGNYMIYRAIWNNLYGTNPKVNENVYALAK